MIRDIPTGGPPIDFEIRNRKGRLVRRFVVPEVDADAFFAALSAKLKAPPKYDPYGDTLLPHEICSRIQAALVSQVLSGVSITPASMALIGDAIGEVAADPGLNMFVIGN